MKTDSTVVDLGGFVIKEVTKTGDSGKDQVKIIEKHGPGFGGHNHMMQPVGIMFVFLAILIIFLGWYYLKKKAEIARLMISNNMSPENLFKIMDDGKGISNFLKFGILFLAIGFAALVNKLLVACGLREFMFPVLFISLGFALLIIHRLNKK